MNIRISTDTRVAPFLQIKYQIAYMIQSGQLAVGDHLPSVRALASSLRVSGGTVMKAYTGLRTDGYVEMRRGRGTVVTGRQPRATLDDEQGRALAEQRLRAAIRYMYAVGFSPAEVPEALYRAYQDVGHVAPIAVVGSTERMSSHYAAELRALLSDLVGLEVRPVTLHPVGFTGKWELEPQDRKTLTDVYYIVTFTTFVDEVAQALGDSADTHRIIGLSIEPTDDTVRELKALNQNDQAVFIASPKFYHSFLPFVTTQLLLPFTSLHIVRESQDGLERLREAVAGADVIVHNIGLSAMLDQLELAHVRRLEMRFRFSDSALENLRLTLRSLTQLLSPEPSSRVPHFAAPASRESDADQGGGTSTVRS